jgi:malate permease and related proteins
MAETGGQAMENIALLVACLVFGVVLRRSGRFPENASAALNGFVIHISLPSLILLYVHRLRIDGSLVYPVVAPWILFAFGLALFVTVARLARWTAPTTGGLILAGSLANTSFVGLPMIETFYGVSFLGLGILIDQLGTYLVLSTLGIIVAVTFSRGNADTVSPGRVLRKIATFAPFQALLLALALRPFDFPAGLEGLLGRLGATLAPLALVSVGYQLRLSDLRGRIPALTLGLLFKLILGPLLITLVLVKLVGIEGQTTQVTIFEAAMAPQIGAAIVAMEHKLDPPLVTLMVGIGIPLSFLTLPLWWYLLRGI